MPAALLGLAANAIAGGARGLEAAALGLALGFAVYLGLYLLRGMGAGDVKLMAAVGALAGPANWFTIFVLTSVLGGVMALAVVLYRRRLGRTLWNVARLMGDLVRLRAPSRHAELDVSSADSVKLAHGVSIAAGTLAFLYLQRGLH